MLGGVQAQNAKSDGPDLTKQPTLYVVGYAHLDTQWRWDYVRTIGEFIPKTMRENFALFEKYPNYIFNFSGSRRYQMMKEYYPAEYAKVKHYIAAGRWFPSGSSVDETDVNSPTAESIIRQILYGSQFFRREFGRTSAEYMLPDCFGFPASLPSILAHLGIKGFSTQKLSPAWQPGALVGGPGSVQNTPPGIPFNVGFWEGPDGKGVIAALNPGSYNGDVRHDLSKSPTPDPNARPALVDWPARIELNGKVSGLLTDFHYYGTGDTGGSPREHSIELVERIITTGTALFPRPQQGGGRAQQQAPTEPKEMRVGEGPLKVISATAEQMFLDILKTGKIDRLPRYKGDLELIQHSAGSLTSQGYVKRWNRKNELLADAAEKASVAAEWLGARPYPLERLNTAWTLVLGSQMHDNLPGTAIPKAYEYVWNDQVLALNQFASVLTSATEAIASRLNTQTSGAAVVVYNPLNIEREDVVEAEVKFTGGAPRAVRVIGPDGKPVPAQMSDGKVVFLAKAPSVGYAVYDIQPANSSASSSTLKVTESSLENARYSVKLDQQGDVGSVFDKKLNKELLSAPIRLAIKTDIPRDWPAWNMDWADQQKPPRAYVGGPAKVRIVENGPARVALEVERETEGSKFVQTIRLSAGDAGNRVEFGLVMDWKIGASNLKVKFPLSASNENATYNWDIGTIERPTAFERQYEVASHQWIDLTDKSGSHGATVLTDCKNGSDKSDDKTINLTLVRTPGIGEGNGWAYNDQTSQDWGRHELVYGLAGHAGDWRREQSDWQAQRLNQPLIAFESAKHRGTLGKSFSLLKISSSRLRVLAVKKAEESNEVIVRLVELDGKPARNVRIAFAAPITDAREVNAMEQPVDAAPGLGAVTNGELVTDWGPYQVRSFAVRLAGAPSRIAPPPSQPVALPYDLAVASQDQTKSVGGFDAAGRALAAEMLPGEITYGGSSFKLGPADKPNAVVARGQTISLPAGRFTRLYLLAASADGDQKATFRVGEKPVELTIQDWGGTIGQWDNRIFDLRQEQLPPAPNAPPGAPMRRRTVWECKGVTPGFIKRAPVAWFASHRHTVDGANEIYAYSYLFAYSIEVPANAKTLTLPSNDKIRILAVTAADESGQVRPAQPLYDTLERAPQFVGSVTSQRMPR
jgi:alpha-mannosidase